MIQSIEENNSKLMPPNEGRKVLLHSCCAPCSGSLIERMIDSGIEVTVYYFNPNIYPHEEYHRRKEENKKFCKGKDIHFIDADYDHDLWIETVKGYENDKERGARCSLCFDMRFEKVAFYAHQNGFTVFASSLGISRWKDLTQVNSSGIKAARKYPSTVYWDYNWRKNGGSQSMQKTAKDNNFYQQKYCGCRFSLQQIDEWRISKGKEKK